MARLVTFENTTTIQEVEFIDKISQRIKLDSMRLSSAVADEFGNIPVYEATLIGYFRTLFSLETVNGEEMKEIIKRVRTSKDPRKEIVKVFEEKAWDDDWEEVLAAHREIFKDDSPETEDNKRNFRLAETGSSTPSALQPVSESSDS